MKIKTQELTGVQLDYAVAKAEGTLARKPRRCFDCKYHEERAGRDEAIYYCHHPKSVHDTDGGWGDAISPDYGVHPRCPITELTPEPYSANWSEAGPIIERECIELEAFDAASSVPKDPMYWQAVIYEHEGECITQGTTPLIAAMRCYVASKLGDEVEIPEGLK